MINVFSSHDLAVPPGPPIPSYPLCRHQVSPDLVKQFKLTKYSSGYSIVLYLCHSISTSEMPLDIKSICHRI